MFLEGFLGHEGLFRGYGNTVDVSGMVAGFGASYGWGLGVNALNACNMRTLWGGNSIVNEEKLYGA